jgi:hypothetical protein
MCLCHAGNDLTVQAETAGLKAFSQSDMKYIVKGSRMKEDPLLYGNCSGLIVLAVAFLHYYFNLFHTVS